jgi:hypothetical protein
MPMESTYCAVQAFATLRLRTAYGCTDSALSYSYQTIIISPTNSSKLFTGVPFGFTISKKHVSNFGVLTN